MLLTDYSRDTPDLTWDIALQCGVRHGTIRLPDDKEFDVTSAAQLRIIYERFLSHVITPLLGSTARIFTSLEAIQKGYILEMKK